MVEVFKTNVAKAEQATELVSLLQQHFPSGRVTFDLEDCDRVLRIESEKIEPAQIVSLLSKHNCECSILS